jgi:hypothetical protein
MVATGTGTGTRQGNGYCRSHKKSDDEPKAEVEQLTEQLHAKVLELTSSDAWVRMLSLAGRFHRYSGRNQMLLWMQAEDREMVLGRVAGYRRWAELGQQVVRGSKALGILAPVRRRLSVEEAQKLAAEGKHAFDNEGRTVMVVRGFRIERLFDVSQTEPQEGREPLPQPTPWAEQSGNGPAGLFDGLAELVSAEGYELEVRPSIQSDGGAHGWTSREKLVVWVNSTCDEAERIRILTHELAHIRCDHFDRNVSRPQGECEADSVAYVVCQALGLDISSSAVDYVATWASRDDPEVLDEALTAIHKAAASILADLQDDEEE